MRGMIQKWKKQENQIKLLLAGMVFATALVLLPLLMISHYNFRSADDYTFGSEAEKVWEQTGSAGKVLVGQLSYTKTFYRTWQGTYFDVWLTSSLLGIFGKHAYYVGTYLSLGCFVAAELVLFGVVLCRILGSDRRRALILSLGCICMQVLLTPVPAEAFFWFCAAIRYTFVYGLALFLVAVWILLYQDREKALWRRGCLVFWLLALTVAVAGSNYVTALSMLLCYVLSAVWFFWKKHRYRYLLAGGLLCYLGAFLLNVTAPGNAVRQRAAGTAPVGAIRAILLSLLEAGRYVLVNSMLPCLLLGALFAPLIVQIVRRKKYRYPLPFLVTLLSWGIFAAQFTPNLYALGIVGTGRIQNLYRFTFYLWLYGNECYWIGWYCRQNAWREEPREKENCYLLPGWIIGGLLFVLSLGVWGGSTVTSYSAFLSLHRGEAQQYQRQHRERLAVLEDSAVLDARLPAFRSAPYVLFFSDISTDETDWLNQSVAAYYGKDTVVLEQEALP